MNDTAELDEATAADREYDDFRERCDNGEQCGLCHWRGTMPRSVVFGIGLFQCLRCGAESVDTRGYLREHAGCESIAP